MLKIVILKWLTNLVKKEYSLLIHYLLVKKYQTSNQEKTMKKNNENWFVIMSKPNQELKAIKNLQNQNFDIFCPYFEKEIGTTFKPSVVKEFLFPSYIFVKLNLENYNWLKIKYTLGVKKFLSMGSIPSQIEKNFVENLKSFSNHEGLINSNFLFFRPNEKVIVTKGPFRNIFG